MLQIREGCASRKYCYSKESRREKANCEGQNGNYTCKTCQDRDDCNFSKCLATYTHSQAMLCLFIRTTYVSPNHSHSRY